MKRYNWPVTRLFVVVCLCNEFIWDWSQQRWTIVSSTHEMTLSWLFRLSFEENANLLLLGQLLLLFILLDTVQEILTTLRFAHVFNTHVDPLGDDPGANPLVDDDTNRSWTNIEDTTSLAVVVLMWHTFMHCSIALDVDNISDAIHLEVS